MFLAFMGAIASARLLPWRCSNDAYPSLGQRVTVVRAREVLAFSALELDRWLMLQVHMQRLGLPHFTISWKDKSGVSQTIGYVRYDAL